MEYNEYYSCPRCSDFFPQEPTHQFFISCRKDIGKRCRIQCRNQFGYLVDWNVNGRDYSINVCNRCKEEFCEVIQLNWGGTPSYEQHDYKNHLDIFKCGRCLNITNQICTTDISFDNFDLNSILPFQGSLIFDGDSYQIKLCEYCRDDLVETITKKWWNAVSDFRLL